jgi:catechol 2,3-dioxygenase-like lactoylglutathione lyase family enzyme
MLDSVIVNPVVPVSDLTRAKNFYAETLGFPVAGEGETWAILRTDGYWFALTVSVAAGTNQATAIEFFIADLDAVMSELRSRGVVFEEYEFEDWSTENGVAEGQEGRSAWFKDTEGNIVGVTQLLAPGMVDQLRGMMGSG